VTPLVIGVLLAVAAMVWVIAPVFIAGTDDDITERATPGERKTMDDAAEAAIRRWREPRS
jgi:hypothetical protein